ncbi:citrate/2-methylcitrate synthase [Desulfoluna spongiiphila]|uniref:Citrate synthase n=1 Tax=Desulfoluna spongiiphila TaxID=419481 RepID=A0A1G5GCY2_9BACT|nr:citrate/2-methylcitrate synthase [Desulfoluna spongiiphila]SCY49100.1 citrate synthase [Desulfoluna spongiiphila]
MDSPIKNIGLRGVVIASTKICDVDGANSRLLYRGYLIQDLAMETTFAEVAHLLLHDKMPDIHELVNFTNQLERNRTLPPNLICAMQTRPVTTPPMDILQACVALLAHHDDSLPENSLPLARNRAMGLIAKLPTVVAAWTRIRQRLEPIEPVPGLSMAENFFYMITGERPDRRIAELFDRALVLHAEHAFNASTFAAREVASTRAHMYAAVSAAIGSLSGELHGGANTRVMEMLKAIGTKENIKPFVEDKLEKGELVMGLGHAVYKNGDPRVEILRPMSKEVGERVGDTHWYEMTEELERVGKALFKEKKDLEIFPNVDFYSASLYHTMGLAHDLFTPVFAMSRVAGWCAHIIEEQFADEAHKPVLYRPESEYIGTYCGPEGCTLVPMDKR